jgi:hypothetical protein
MGQGGQPRHRREADVNSALDIVLGVMPGLVPSIHVLLPLHAKDVDGRDKPGHDDIKD